MPKDIISRLEKYFRGKKVVIAFSGGLDSTVLLEIALQSASNVLPVIVKSTLQPAAEIKHAIEYLARAKIKYEILGVNPLEHPEVVENDPRRCYYCKRLIFQTIIKETKKYEYDFIAEGSNVTDLSDYRPGLEALVELGIQSPYLKLKITKEEIKKVAIKLNLEVKDKPATTCLATRIPYGNKLSEEKLNRIDIAESIIRETFPVFNLRVRDHGDVARIEVSMQDMRYFFEKGKIEKIIDKLKGLGFDYIALDLEGYRQGSMNIPIPEAKRGEQTETSTTD
ncbi:MAG: ATP-dependent sacrificial sulfur transferase LarE [Candidatus Heimdallarchaeota archaeon]|nr:ATP-dependent sacrificial sulfur transferase LarE [Candidatus Heimdallarchaeota archaeon]